MEATHTRQRMTRRRAFTLTELLVVVAILGILITISFGGARQVIYSQRRTYTQTLINNLQTATETFGQLNPLNAPLSAGGVGPPQFGPYPPYQLDFDTWSDIDGTYGETAASVALGASYDPAGDPPPPIASTLRQRLAYHAYGRAGDGDGLQNSDYLRVAEVLRSDIPTGFSDENVNDLEAVIHDDNRALYAFFALYMDEPIQQYPDKLRRALPVPTRVLGTGNFIDSEPPGGDRVLDEGEFVTPLDNLTGDTETLARIPILGFYDAWGVPIDYFLYARLEVVPNLADTDAEKEPMWDITALRPVIRSRGLRRSEYERLLRNHLIDGTAYDAFPDRWLLSQPLPSPVAINAFPSNQRQPGGGGDLLDADSTADGLEPPERSGWIRLRGLAEQYGYVPAQDYRTPED